MSGGWTNRSTLVATTRLTRRRNSGVAPRISIEHHGRSEMERKMKELADLYQARQIGRRELMRRAGPPGLRAAAASFLFNPPTPRALAAAFAWKAKKGKTPPRPLTKHPHPHPKVAGR